MQYMGGKAKIAKRLFTAIAEVTPQRAIWFEPFVGGANVIEHAAPMFERCIGMDAHEDLILLWRACASGWTPPEFVSREEYQLLRRAEPSALRGFAGFGASFGGRWFEGYGVSPRDGELCRASYRTVCRQARVLREHQVEFIHTPFGQRAPEPGSVVYCDPPYHGTKFYSGLKPLDYEFFYSTLKVWARDCDVFVSEYSDPLVPFEVVWQTERRCSIKKSTNESVVTENLFRILP